MLMVLNPEKAVVLNQGQNAMPGDVFRCQNQVSATSIPSAEVRDAAKHPTIHRTDPIPRNYLVPSVNDGLPGGSAIKNLPAIQET